MGYKNVLFWVTKMEWIGLQEFQKPLSQNRLTAVECILDMSLKNIQNEKWIYLYNHRIYSLVCRYKAHEADHGIPRGRPHISILGGNRDADDFRTCWDAGTV